MMSAEPFDVVVSDMRMPQMDGAQFLETVRDRWPATARIILSGFAENESVMRTIGPAHIYLAKPCDAQVLRAAVQRQIDLRAVLTSCRRSLLQQRLLVLREGEREAGRSGGKYALA